MEGDRFGLAGGVTVGSWASSARLEARWRSLLRDEISAHTISASSSSSAAASHAAAPVVAAAGGGGGGDGGGGDLAADVEADLPGPVAVAAGGSRVVVPGGGGPAAAPNVAFHRCSAAASSSAFVLATSSASAAASASEVAMARPMPLGGGRWPRPARARDSWQQDGPRREAPPEADTDAAGRLAPPAVASPSEILAPISLCCLPRERVLPAARSPSEIPAPISLCSSKVSSSASASAEAASEEAAAAEEAGAAEAETEAEAEVEIAAATVGVHTPQAKVYG